jgi:hypothetical protein
MCALRAGADGRDHPVQVGRFCRSIALHKLLSRVANKVAATTVGAENMRNINCLGLAWSLLT